MILFHRNLTILEGGRLQQPFVWKADGVAVDLTGYTAAMTVRAALADTTPLLEYSTEGGVLVIADQVTDPGKITIDAPSVTTEGICAEHRDLKGVYDLLLSDAAGRPALLIYGTAFIKAAVHRPWEEEA
jgi:hypothetical protein